MIRRHALVVAVVVISFLLSSADLVLANGQRYDGSQHERSRSSVLKIGPEVLQKLSDDEREWYRRFQEGVLFFDGWMAISEELLEIFPEDSWPDKQALMQRLGIKIGTEWARKNSERKIDTTMLQDWGDQLRFARGCGAEATVLALQQIEREVDRILREDQERLSQISR